MHQSARIRRADIHTRALANSIKAFQNRKIFGGVGIQLFCYLFGSHGDEGYLRKVLAGAIRAEGGEKYVQLLRIAPEYGEKYLIPRLIVPGIKR